MKRIFLLFLAAILAVGMSGCGNRRNSGGPDDSSASDVPGGSSLTVSFTDYDLVKNGKSDYAIVIPGEGPTAAETLGYSDLKTYFKKATGAELEILTDDKVQWSESVSYLSVGNTRLLEQAGVAVDDDIVGVNGYRLETKGARCLWRAVKNTELYTPCITSCAIASASRFMPSTK